MIGSLRSKADNYMAYLFLALLLFCASVMTHVFFCRKASKSCLQAKAFIFIAFIFLLVYFFGGAIIQRSGVLPLASVWGLPFRISSGVIFILLIPVYLCFYVLTQLTSPSKKILKSIARQGSVSYADILTCVKEEDFINTRLNDLCASGCVAQNNGRYVLTSEGQKIALTLNLMQFFLGRKVGG